MSNIKMRLPGGIEVVVREGTSEAELGRKAETAGGGRWFPEFQGQAEPGL